MQQTFSVEKEARILLARIHGDLEVRGWDGQGIRLERDTESGVVQQEGNMLSLSNCSGDIELLVPFDAEVRAESVDGEVEVQDIRRVELKNIHGDVQLRNIGVDANLDYIGEAISLIDIDKDVEIQKASSLRTRRKIGGEARIQEVRLAEIEAVRSDLELRQVDMASVGSVGGDLEAVSVREALRCGNVGGDCQIHDSAGAEFHLGNVGGHLQLGGAVKVHVGNTGDHVELRDVRESVYLGNVGNSGTLSSIGGNVTAGRIGGDAHLSGLGGSVRIGAVGGDLELQADFPPESRTHAHVGGDVTLTLPQTANLALQATIGGTISGPSLALDRNGNLVRLVYGDGSAQASISAGGDLQVHGGGTPRVSSASMPWGEFNQEMSELGKNMAQMGTDLGREFMDIFNDMGQATFSWGDDVGRRVEEQLRRARHKAEQHARHAAERVRKAEEHARRAEERAQRHAYEHARRHADRLYVRVNEREWQMNPERFNDLINRAQEAALDGVAGAMEAVERAVNNLRMQYPPRPPMPPTPPGGAPMPPTPPAPPSGIPTPPTPPTGEVTPPMPPIPPYPVATPPANEPSQQSESEEAENTEEPNLEAEREAILRMIAEGRISPEEGDMLLEGLGE
ncbi:MAG TPA: hypothetical protein VHD63_22310 [Ktedonobacteraceae bacterium]|nr:hypothetical protein [Ktedonobacteraceae bacterium]